ncbi:MAG: tripartite tricarboxylate transporter substrate binding protein [Pseudolabrys sp.]|jgi:tripartite-type tricarboxylate transporter receptor subunit TctC
MKRLIAVLFAALALSVGMATAQDQYPSRPVKVIVPYAPGGATDIVARIVGDAFQKVTGQPFVVLNKPGAFGMLAIDEMVKAAPDGYTVMIGNVSTNAITPIIYANKMSFDYAKSVVAVTNLIDVPAFLLVTTANDFPVKSFAEFVAYAKQNPGKVSYGTVGVGSYPHYDMAYLAKRAGDLDLVALPNKNGAAGVIQDMLRGDVQAAFLNAASSAGQIQAGKFRPLAVVNQSRLKDYPDIPTMKEVGYPDVGTVAWNGLFAPAATPKPVLEALFAAVNKTLSSPEAIEKLNKQNFNVVPNKSLADAKTWLDGEIKHWQTITTAVKIDMTQ